MYYENKPIGCTFCGYGPNAGRESTFSDRRGVVTECRWHCGRCQKLIRVEENVQPKEEKKEETKETKDTNEKKK